MAGEKQLGSTRDDVARLAKVSPATVSRAYNCPDLVSEAKLKAIRSAAKKLGYVPDRNASALRRNGSGSMLLVMRAPETEDYSESRVYRWFYGEAIINAQAALESSSYQFKVALWKQPEPLESFLSRNPCDGTVFGLGCVNGEVEDFARTSGKPYVLCAQMDSLPADLNICYIDEEAGGSEAAKSLLACGRKRLAHISGNMGEMDVCKARWEGFRSGAMASGCEEPLLINGKLGIAGGYESGLRLAPHVEAGEVDGLFVVNDLSAVGVAQALISKEVKIPETLAVVAYDNLPITQTLPVKLASVDVSIGRLYGLAMESLSRMMRKPLEKPLRERVIPKLVPGPSLPHR